MVIPVSIVSPRRVAVRGAIRIPGVLVVVIPVGGIARITGPGIVVVAGVGSRSGWVRVALIIVVRIGVAVSIGRAIET